MRLKILQIFSRYLHYGGEEGSVYRIGDALQEIHDVEYFLGSSKDIFEGNSAESLLAPFYALYNPRVISRLRRYQQIGKFDVWQIHNVFVGLSPGVYAEAFRMGVPVVHYLHNYRFGCLRGNFIREGKPCSLCTTGKYWHGMRYGCWRNHRFLSGWMALMLLYTLRLGLVQKTVAWIALSEVERARHIQMGFPADRIHIVPHFYSPSPKTLPFSDKKTAMYIGRLSSEKGIDRLLRAWKLAGQPDAQLLIVGEGPERPKLERLCENLGLSNVIFTGFIARKDQDELWRQTLFTIVPSIWDEPFGMVVLESWDRGRAVLAANRGALPEIVGNSQGGEVFDIEDPDELAVRIRTWLDKPEQAIAAGNTGRQRLCTEFSKEVWLQRIGRLYEHIR